MRLAHAPQTCAARPSNQRVVAFASALLVPRVTTACDVRWKHHEHVASARCVEIDPVPFVVVVATDDDLFVASVDVVEPAERCVCRPG